MTKLFLLVLLCLNNTAFSNPRRLKVAVFGDSVTAGVFANEKMGAPSWEYYRNTKHMVKGMLFHILSGTKIDPQTGDNLDLFNYLGKLMTRPHYSFLLGRTKYSLKRKRQKLGVDVELVDLSLLVSWLRSIQPCCKKTCLQC